jgi:hypothetical protein
MPVEKIALLRHVSKGLCPMLKSLEYYAYCAKVNPINKVRLTYPKPTALYIGPTMVYPLQCAARNN